MLASNNPRVIPLLENLPPQLRRSLLRRLDLEGLGALVHASPVFHAQYLRHRRVILCACLETTLESVLLDAFAVCQSQSVDFSLARTDESVKVFLLGYRNRRRLDNFSIRTERLSEDELVDMVVFYFKVQKLIGSYVDLALARLDREIGELIDEEPPIQEPLSQTEKIRVMRAFYRLQLCCNMFGNGSHVTSWITHPHLDLPSIDSWDVFFDLLEPWEVEEIACVYTFAKEKYEEIFQDIRRDVDGTVDPDNPDRFQRPGTPEGAFYLDNSLDREMLLVGIVSRGLEILHTVLYRMTNHAQLVTTMQEYMSLPLGRFLEYLVLSERAQVNRRAERYSHRDLLQDAGETLSFEGDEPDAPSPHPPLAWMLMWHGHYSNLYGHYVPEATRSWGYVMWDEDRINGGADKVVEEQWDEEWGSDDPRWYM